MSNPLKVVAEILGIYPQTGDVNQLAYCFTDTAVILGVPPVPLGGLDSVRCRFIAPRAKRFPSLGGGACFLSNRNTSGEINLRFMQGAFSVANVELQNASGIPIPIIISDKSSGGTASVIGTACRVIDVGEFVREGEAPLIEFKIEADRMVMFHGLRLPFIVT
jgi:hypothetical protein